MDRDTARALTDAGYMQVAEYVRQYGGDMPGTEKMLPASLGEAITLEMARVRDKVMPPYIAIGPGASFALSCMRLDLDRAAKSLAEGDVISMISIYKTLKEYKA
jgi:hypothetical protein